MGEHSELTKCILAEVERGESTVESLRDDAAWYSRSPNQVEREMGQGISEAITILQSQQ